MRTKEQKKKITDRYGRVTVHKDAVDQELVNYLLNQFHNYQYKVEKNTGPVVMNYSPDRNGYEEWFEPVQQFVDNLIGKSLVCASNIFKTEIPHVVHNDDYYEKIYDIFKTVVIPLEIKEPTNFVVYDQYYLDGPIKCFRGFSNIPETYYNEPLTDYSDIVNFTDQPFDEKVYKKYLTHLPYESLHGFTVEEVVKWQPGDAITFDMGKLHSGTNFKEHGIDYKIGYSIFTAK